MPIDAYEHMLLIWSRLAGGGARLLSWLHVPFCRSLSGRLLDMADILQA